MSYGLRDETLLAFASTHTLSWDNSRCVLRCGSDALFLLLMPPTFSIGPR